MPWILEHLCDSWFWDVPKIKALAARPRMAWAPVEFSRTLFLVGKVDSRVWHRTARKCGGTSGRCSVSGQKHVHPNASASRSECCSSRDHTRPLRLSFALAVVLTVEARRFQRTHPLSGMGSSLNASKDTGMGLFTRCSPVHLNQRWSMQVVTRSDLPMYALLETHDSHSLLNNNNGYH